MEDPAIVGIDHAFSFPLQYFETHGLPLDWPGFLEDFRRHWPTHQDHTDVDFIDDDFCRRVGDASWFRLTERWTAGAKSVFRFDVQGAVAKSTHAGLPWPLYLRENCERTSSLLAVRGLERSSRLSILRTYLAPWEFQVAQIDVSEVCTGEQLCADEQGERTSSAVFTVFERCDCCYTSRGPKFGFVDSLRQSPTASESFFWGSLFTKLSDSYNAHELARSLPDLINFLEFSVGDQRG